jgi:hypothetical protein
VSKKEILKFSCTSCPAYLFEVSHYGFTTPDDHGTVRLLAQFKSIGSMIRDTPPVLHRMNCLPAKLTLIGLCRIHLMESMSSTKTTMNILEMLRKIIEISEFHASCLFTISVIGDGSLWPIISVWFPYIPPAIVSMAII